MDVQSHLRLQARRECEDDVFLLRPDQAEHMSTNGLSMNRSRLFERSTSLR